MTYLGWNGAVDKEQVCVLYSVLCEFSSVVLCLVESDHVRHVEMLEDLKVVFRRICTSLKCTLLVDRAHKRNEFVRDNEIEVSVLNFLVVFVLFVIKLAEIVPAVAHRYLESLQAMKD